MIEPSQKTQTITAGKYLPQQISTHTKMIKTTPNPKYYYSYSRNLKDNMVNIYKMYQTKEHLHNHTVAVG